MGLPISVALHVCVNEVFQIVCVCKCVCVFVGEWVCVCERESAGTCMSLNSVRVKGIFVC
jgi:hypothetical protein